MVGRAAALQSVLVLARQASRARKLSSICGRQAAAPLHRALGAARPTPLAASPRPLGTPSRWVASQRGLAAACTRAAAHEEMAAATGGSGAAQRPLLLPEELRAQFSQQIDVLAIRLPKQSTNQYMKRLSK